MARRTNKVKTVIQEKADITVHTFDQCTEEFFRNCMLKGLEEPTIKFYKKEIKNIRNVWIDLGVPLYDVSLIKTRHAEMWLEEMYRQDRAISTINARMRTAKYFFKWCQKNKYIDYSPFSSLEPLRKRKKVGRTFSKRELDKLLREPNTETFTGLRDLAIMLTFAHTGMRLKELCCLKVQDISFDGKGEINIQEAKNRKGRRIPMTRRLKKVLQVYMEERGQLDHDALFVSLENNPIVDRTVQERLQWYGKKCKVAECSPHAFRRTFCRMKVEAGVNLFTLQKLSGHSDLDILKQYVEIYSKDLENVIEMGC